MNYTKRYFLIIISILYLVFDSKGQNTDSLGYLYSLSLKELMEVNIITASKKEEPVNQAPATMMVITYEQIRDRGYESLEDALRDLPGIDFVHVQGTFPTIWALRGAYGDENKRTVLMIDGVIENNILEGNVLGGPQYSLHNVEQIEVIWGPASALYGANAFSGIINIITKKGKNINGFEYQKGYGSYNTKFDKFLTGMSKDDFEFSLSGSLYNTDGPVFKERHPEYNNSYVDNAYSLVGRIKLKNITLGFNRFDRPMGEGQFSNTPGFYELPPYGYQNSEGTSWGMAQTDINGKKGSLWHSITQTTFFSTNYNITSNLLLSGKVFYRKTGIAEDSYEYDYAGDGKFNRDTYAHTSSSITGELQLDYTINGNQDIISGVQYERSDVERGYRGTEIISDNGQYRIKRLLDKNQRINNIYQNFAGYTQYRLKTKLMKSTNFILGLRYDYNDIYGKTLNPRLGFVIKQNKKLVIKGLYRTAYRAPNSFEMFTETNVRVKNPGLVPERVKGCETGIGYGITGNILIEGSFFYNKFKNIIVSNVPVGDVTGDGIENYQNQNKGTAEIWGIELKMNAFLTKDFSIYANYTFQGATQTDIANSFDIPNIADHKGNFRCKYIFKDFLIIHFSENMVGKRSTATSNPFNEIDGYFISNFTISISTKRLFNPS